MKIAVFFTFNYSVKLLKDSGLFNREMRIYEELSKYGYQFTFFTYDKNYDELKSYKNFEFISVYEHIKFSENKLLNFIKTFILPIKISKQLKEFDILHQHQLMGSWIVIILKYILKKPLLIRTGYDAYLISYFKDKEIDQSSIGQYLSYGVVFSPNNILKNYKKINPSTYLEIDYSENKFNTKFEKYWK